jgi:predicted dehydrogenase
VALRHPDQVRFVAVAEPNEERRHRFAAAHQLPPERCFAHADDLLAAGQLGDGALVATPDRHHVAPTLGALEAGYHVLVEKPMAPTAEECVAMVTAAERRGRQLAVCHVLRTTPFFRALHQLIDDGRLGQLVSVEHRENVASWHMAHSYVRGAYGNVGRATPMILAKCCHDLDLLVWNLRSPVRTVSSTGGLVHFTSSHAPDGAPTRCTEGCPAAAWCPHEAVHIYLGRPDDHVPGGWRAETPFAFMPLTDHGEWVPSVGLSETPGERLDALRHGPYGRCVYRCDNDAVDQQVVVLGLADGSSATLVVHGHSDDDQRTLRYDGSSATAQGRFGDFSGEALTLHPHRGGPTEEIPIERGDGLHGGGDRGVLLDFAALVRGEDVGHTAGRDALASHLLGFAAEEARRRATVVDMQAFAAAHSVDWP